MILSAARTQMKTWTRVVVGALLWSFLGAWQSYSQDAMGEALQRIYNEYSSQQSRPDISRLVVLDQQLRDLVPYHAWQGRPWLEARYYRPEYESMGVSTALFEPDFLTYSGKLLAEAHARDPNSAYRSYTLYSTVFGDVGEPANGAPSPTAAEAYLREFPAGPFGVHAAMALAHFYHELFQVIQAAAQGMDYKNHCYGKYLDATPLPEQQKRAQETAIRYYERLLELLPQNDSEKQHLADLRRGSSYYGFYCGD